MLAAVNVCGFAAALIALAAGAPSHRFRSVAVFLGIGGTAAIYLEVANALARRRARAQSTAPVPRDVPLRKPLWISAMDGAPIMMLATPLGALAGAAGFASVGAGVLLTVLGLTTAMFYLGHIVEPHSLTFEREGLRVRIRGATFLVEWRAIVDIARSGHEGRLVRVQLSGTRLVLDSVEPATERARSRAFLAIGAGAEPTSVLTLSPWTGGIDSAVLARALLAASEGKTECAN